MIEVKHQSKVSVTSTEINDVLILEPKVFGDQRGWFTESFNAQDFEVVTGLNIHFVQDKLGRFQLEIDEFGVLDKVKEKAISAIIKHYESKS